MYFSFSLSLLKIRAVSVDPKVTWVVLVLGAEHKAKLKLEEELRAVEDTLRYKSRQFQELQQDIQVGVEQTTQKKQLVLYLTQPES